jgi:hypothetical protein
MPYFTIIDDDYNRLYQTGININIRGVSNSVDVCDLEELAENYSNGDNKYLRLVIFPHDTCKGKFILSDEYYIYDKKTITRFNLIINPDYVTTICEMEDINMLNYLDSIDNMGNFEKVNGFEFEHTFDRISIQNNVKILEWWKNSGRSFIYSEYSMMYASVGNNINVLEWWKNSGLPLKYDNKAIDKLSYHNQNNNVKVLEWWKQSGLPLKYSEDALDIASSEGNIEVLEWWFNSNLELKYSEQGLNIASSRHYINVLDLWKKSGLPLKYSEYALDSQSLSFCNDDGVNVEVLEWWFNSGLELKYSEWSLDRASWYGFINILNWWKNSGLELKYSSEAMDQASENGHSDVLEWWFNSGLELKYSENALNNLQFKQLVINDHVRTFCDEKYRSKFDCVKFANVLCWWYNSGLPLKYNKELCNIDNNIDNVNNYDIKIPEKFSIIREIWKKILEKH